MSGEVMSGHPGAAAASAASAASESLLSVTRQLLGAWRIDKRR